ncbi:nucleotidyltransferase [Cytophaga sp. FL35]|uniref:nucleotidyltransferase n=1 Tax=Cytophaga sp. FL35 TaxID=1904456 RepID=UPI0016538D53|nr:nucleotidyltransferase [Cytophaga sp. FL35]MBC7000336.1 nucleotidyltransferase [Cytophaga sp. FL35]
MAFNKTDYLNDVLETHRMSKIEDLVGKFKVKRDNVKSALSEHYGDKIYYPFDSGSFKKHTAINIKFDLDVVAPFKRNSFETLEVMFDDLFDFLSDKYNDEAYVRKQKVSIGIEFSEDEDGDVISLDIVPGRELNQDQYVDDKNLNLYVYSKYGLFDKSTYIQTNIHSQLEHIRAKKEERKIIRLLKIWKNRNHESYKSFLLELFTIKAFAKEKITGNLWEKLKTVMVYIQDNVEDKGFKLFDPGNSNNDVLDTLERWERSNLASRMGIIVERVDENAENLKNYFPINEKFEDNDSAGSSYGIKGSSVAASIPPTNQRFG